MLFRINPYQNLDIYGEKYLNTYIDNVNDESQASSTPHVYGVAESLQNARQLEKVKVF